MELVLYCLSDDSTSRGSRGIPCGVALLPPIESSNFVGEPKIVRQQRLAGVG